MKIILALALTAAFVAAQDEAPKPTANTEFGKLEGDMGTSRAGRMYYKFKGIPFAKAERFEVPQKPDKWEGVKDATKFGSPCVQHDNFMNTNTGKDDCLFLNVFTPKMNKEGDHKVLLPVMVYIHPGFGAFTFGDSSAFGAKYFMDNDVVLVTFNYRLGVFGFLNTGDEHAQGNMGLKDQVAALKWVKENIENFGGDKARVTIFGSSAGAASTLYHTLSPMSKGLFQNAIAQSGSPLTPWAFVPNPVAQAKKLGQQLGCPIDTSENLVKCLKEMDPVDLVTKKTVLDPLKWNYDDVTSFAPSIETPLKDQKDTDIFLSEAPFKLYTEGKVVNKVPVILTLNDKDGHILPSVMVMNNTEALEKFGKEWNKLAPLSFFYDQTATDKDAVSKKLKDFYFGDKEIKADAHTRKQLTKLYFDRYFMIAARHVGKVYSKIVPTYLGLFTRKPEYGFMNFYGVDKKEIETGVSHLDEIQNFVKPIVPEMYKDSPLFPKEITKDHPQYMFSDQIIKLWASFAETGKPTKVWSDAKEWKKTEFNEQPKLLKLTDTLKPIDEANPSTPEDKEVIEDIHKRADFWRKLYSEELSAEVKPPPKEKF